MGSPNGRDGVWNHADDGNCIVNISDLCELLGANGTTTGGTREDGDIYPPGTGDGAFSIQNVTELLGQYGDDGNYSPNRCLSVGLAIRRNSNHEAQREVLPAVLLLTELARTYGQSPKSSE